MNITNIYKLFHPITKYIFFTTTHRIFSRIDQMLGHKTSLKKFKRIGIIPSTFFYHNVMRLEI